MHLGFIASLLVRFMLANKNLLPAGWSSRVLIQCGVRFAEIWDIFNEMYESQVRSFRLLSPFSIRSHSGNEMKRCHLSTTKQMCRPFLLKLLFLSRIGWLRPFDRRPISCGVNSQLVVSTLRLINTCRSSNRVASKQRICMKVPNVSLGSTGKNTLARLL